MSGADVQYGLQYGLMREFLQEKAGFQFGLALCDAPDERRIVIEALKNDLDAVGFRLRLLDLADHPGRVDLLTMLKDVLASEKPDAVTVIGLEPHLLEKEIVSQAGLLANTNWQRDAYPEHCPTPLLLWGPSHAVHAFATRAPDFWHWRAGTFDLTDGGLDDEPEPGLR